MDSHGYVSDVAPEEVRSELSRILTSLEFSASRQLTNFLKYIVSQSLAGHSENLKERNVAIALGRGPDFDPRLDCVVRVTAGKLRRSLERYYAMQGASDTICINVPKGGYCPVFRRKNQAVQASNDSTTAALANPPTHLIATIPKVAVVPLISLTGGSKERFFADMLADDVAVRLARMDHLQVIDCRTIQSRFNSSEDLRQLGLRLQANFAFGGTMSKVLDHVRVTVRLVDSDSAVLVWGDQYDLHPDNHWLEQHDEVADRIAASISHLFGFA